MTDCPKCGHRNPPEGDRCESCGASLQPAGPAPSESFEKELLALLVQGQKIQAIKRYREQTGLGLKEAKDAVEALASKHGVKGTGCASALLFLLMLGGSLAYLLVC